MHTDRKNEWKCQNCRKSKSPLPNIVIDDANQQKQQRDEDDANDMREDNAKRSKDSLSLNALNSKICTLQSDVSEIKTTIQSIAQNVNTGNTQIREEIQQALSTITSTIANLSTQVIELYDKNKENTKQIGEMETRINKLEQKAINKNIEINNVQKQNLSALDVVKKIASSLAIDLDTADINDAYILKRRNKIIVEFCSLNKKKEIMEKIKGHRVDANVLNSNEKNKSTTDKQNKYLYINDELTAYNRRLLWLTKTKAKECNWKFVWGQEWQHLCTESRKCPSHHRQ